MFICFNDGTPYLLGYICVNKVRKATLSLGFLKTSMYWAFLEMVLAYFAFGNVLTQLEHGDVEKVGILSEQIQNVLVISPF